MNKQMLQWSLLVSLILLGCMQAQGADNKTEPHQGQPRLVLVEVPSWKTTFFNLPRDLPLLIPAGETFEGKSRHYDFNDGLEAMEVFLALRPKDEKASAYRIFLEKWPLYQKFFKAIDQEQYEESSGLLKQIMLLDPKEPAVYFYWGSLQTHLGKYADAEKNYQTCLRYFPEYGPAYINLARLAKARGGDLEAKKYLEEAVRRLHSDGQEDALHLAEKMLESLKGK